MRSLEITRSSLKGPTECCAGLASPRRLRQERASHRYLGVPLHDLDRLPARSFLEK